MATDVPEGANQHCPGASSDEAGKASACAGCPNQAACATAPKGPDPDLAAIAERLATIKHVILVLSGKGGVGKSTFSAQLAFSLAARGLEVGLMDIDICGPSIPKMLGLEGEEIHQSNLGWSPVYVQENLGVMSIGFMLPNPDDAVIWRGPRKNGLIKQFLKDVHWGDLDYLVIDSPPGTSDEHISIVQFLKAGHVDGAVVVTTPQEVSIIDVRKEINFCKKTGIPVLGVVENMSGLRQALPAFRFLSPAGRDITEAILQASSQLPALGSADVEEESFASAADDGLLPAQHGWKYKSQIRDAAPPSGAAQRPFSEGPLNLVVSWPEAVADYILGAQQPQLGVDNPQHYTLSAPFALEGQYVLPTAGTTAVISRNSHLFDPSMGKWPRCCCLDQTLWMGAHSPVEGLSSCELWLKIVVLPAAAANVAQLADAANGTSVAAGPGAVSAVTEVFHASGGGAERMAQDMGVPFLGRVPLDPALSRAAEEGRSVFDDPQQAQQNGGKAQAGQVVPGRAAVAASAPALQAIIGQLLAAFGEDPGQGE
ncbi:hypothetical protein N2152v2_010515 [Parachlorella kessleri]